MSILSSNNIANFSSPYAFPVHSEYKEYILRWVKIRDAIEGEEAVKARGVAYLPKLSAQKEEDYNAYKARAVFLNTSARVLNTNSGTVTRRSPDIISNEEMKPYFIDDSPGITSFFELFRFTVRELASVGRMGMSIDIKNNKPVPIRFTTENIISWDLNAEGEIQVILLAVNTLSIDRETFEQSSDINYIKLYINDKGIYTVMKMDSDKKVLSDVSPSLRGKTLDYIPFVPLNSFGIGIEPIKPPIIDVVSVNYSHYRTSADLETGRHFVGLPQPVITGASSDSDLYVGSSKAWCLPNKDAKAFYMEFLGQGLEGLAKALKEKEGQMATFSAQLTDTSTRGSEAEGTVRLRYSTDAANLADIAKSAELGLNKLYGMIADWLGTEKPTIELNKDFLTDKMTFNELKQITQTWLDGGFTDEEYRYNLYKGEMLPSKK